MLCFAKRADLLVRVLNEADVEANTGFDATGSSSIFEIIEVKLSSSSSVSSVSEQIKWVVVVVDSLVTISINFFWFTVIYFIIKKYNNLYN